MLTFVCIITLIFVLYQHIYIRTHLKYDFNCKDVLIVTKKNIIDDFKNGATVIELSNSLYKLTKKHFKGYTKVMARTSVEKIIMEHLKKIELEVKKYEEIIS